MKTSKDNILIIPDTHAPFNHPRMLEFLKEVKRKYKTGRTIHLGDVVDFHAFSTHPREEEAHAPTELRDAKEQIAKLAKLFPELECVWGNHDIRIFKRLKEIGIPCEVLQSFNNLIGAPKSWSWDIKIKVPTKQGLVIFEHGDSAKDAITAAIKNGCSTVMGHLHSKSGIEYYRNEVGQFFGCAVGSLVDETAYGFKYAKTVKTKNIYSCGVLIDGVPYIEPLL